MLFSPYHAVVRAVLRRAYADLSAGKTESIARQFHRDGVFRFSGSHALGGELHGPDQVAALFARFHRLFPNLTIAPIHVIVSGGPWATTVAARFRVKATLPGGEPYENEGMQYLRLRWAAIVEDRLFEDTEQLCAALRWIANAGNLEALAPPLGSASSSNGTARPEPSIT